MKKRFKNLAVLFSISSMILVGGINASAHDDHIGGLATCTDQAVCDLCGELYGEVDLTNHVGDTEVRNTKVATCSTEGYTGDTYCTSCNTKIADGTIIPKDPNKHEFVKIMLRPTCTHDIEHITACANCKYIESISFDSDFMLGHIDNDNDHYCDRENMIFNSETLSIDTAVCGEKISECGGGTATCTTQAICEICGNPYGEVDLTNHVGDTEVIDFKYATCTEEGYTGYTYCTSCNTKIADGSVIPKNPNKHNIAKSVEFMLHPTCTRSSEMIEACANCKCIVISEFDFDFMLGHIDNNNDHYCDRENEIFNPETLSIDTAVCGEKISECTGGEATCTTQAICGICGNPYGEVDLTNHVGDTEVRDYKYATCTEEGYTGDTYCTSCNTKLRGGNIIPAANHNDSDNDHYCNNKFYNHFNVLISECNEKISECTGGEATCTTQAICDICGNPYGEVDLTNHIGDREVRNAKEATCTEEGYTGDTYCTSCNTKIADGSVIPVLDHIDDNKDHYCDREICKSKLSECTGGGTATCAAQAICKYCNNPYGEVDLTNHVGGTEVRNSKEATCTEEGYTGDTYCTSCNTKIADGTIIPVLGHVDDNNDNICDRKNCKNIINPNLTKPEPKPQTNDDDGAVKTGDSTPLLQIFVLFSISGLAMCVIILSKVRTHKK